MTTVDEHVSKTSTYSWSWGPQKLAENDWEINLTVGTEALRNSNHAQQQPVLCF